MNETAPASSTFRELITVVIAPHHLKRTVSVALIVGTAFFAMNQLGVILDGRATALVWFKAALTYLTPLVVSNFGVLSATRRPPSPTPRPSVQLTHTEASTKEGNSAMDEAKMMEFVEKAVGDVGALLGGAMVVIGDKLGLYRAMAGAGWLTPAELAARTGTAERYVREWLSAQAARGY